MSEAFALDTAGLSKSFGGVAALKGLNLAIEPGCFFGLLGPNGAGKSTLMSIVSGFLQQDEGTINLFGESLNPDDPGQKKLIGLAPQNIALYKELSAEGNLSLFGRLQGLGGAELKTRVDEALELAQLQDRRKSAVKEFSGGMKRRLNIAVALLHYPKILLCDEPTVGVDPQSRNAIFDTLLQLKEQGLTVVYSTHYMEEAERLCDRIAIIDHGEILREGELDRLLQELPDIERITIRSCNLDAQYRSVFGSFGELREQNGSIHLKPFDDFRLSGFYRWIEEENLDARDFVVDRPSLENLFLQLTGRELRE